MLSRLERSARVEHERGAARLRWPSSSARLALGAHRQVPLPQRLLRAVEVACDELREQVGLPRCEELRPSPCARASRRPWCRTSTSSGARSARRPARAGRARAGSRRSSPVRAARSGRHGGGRRTRASPAPRPQPPPAPGARSAWPRCRRRSPARRAERHRRLDQAPQVVEPCQVLQGEPGGERARCGEVLTEPLGLEPSQRLPDRDVADAEALPRARRPGCGRPARSRRRGSRGGAVR